MSSVLAFPLKNKALCATLKPIEHHSDESLLDIFTISLHEAAICAEDHIFSLKKGHNICPKCGSNSWMRMADAGIRPMHQAVLAAVPVENWRG